MQPTHIKLHRKSGILELTWAETVFPLSAEYLRVFSPSAEVTGHGPGQEVLQLNKSGVQITGVEPQGNYAIKLVFSDGHDTGIYTWQYLHELATNHTANWQDYLQRVAAHKQEEEAAQTSAVKWVDP
ncbi:gamma-butyrobetaine hydroxylase-like domain-containing protein [Teredinibacter turnerae]|uniref:gamma-butyrobetaine hydroxylase-like domain-containing protein n=1 Tax=Teredinibacter turnerae TaxID=2426 RepID=UPI0004033B7F|nr:DUF971 domain-containing protein [Teredinibacter turnerae]